MRILFQVVIKPVLFYISNYPWIYSFDCVLGMY